MKWRVVDKVVEHPELPIEHPARFTVQFHYEGGDEGVELGSNSDQSREVENGEE